MNHLKTVITVIKKTSPETRSRLTVIAILLIFFNILIWTVTFLYIKTYSLLLGLVGIAYGLGLRHAFDPDHIAAIDNTTRKLINDGKRPVATGFFFSLGHSTIVILLSVAIIFAAAFIQNNLTVYKQVGGILGTAISSAFLLIIGIINLVSLIQLFKLWRLTKKKEKDTHKALHNHLSNNGFLTRMLKPFLKTISDSWHMYPVGLLFGLGFDTASEIALLSISATTSASGIPPILILLLPFSFTAGMTLIDSLDGILMLGAYGWAYINPEKKLLYNVIIVLFSVLVAFVIGGIEILQLL